MSGFQYQRETANPPIDFDFARHDTQYLTHGFHPYPAKMIPQVARKLIDEYGKNAKLLLDPFCGTGTALVEARLSNMNAVGFELNPLARLIAQVKTTNIEENTLRLYLKDFHDYTFGIVYGFSKPQVERPKYPNISYWFSKKVQRDLSLVRQYIRHSIDNETVRDFFLVAFSYTIRLCSWTRNDEFKLYKMPKEKIRYFNPEVFSVMETILSRNYHGLRDFNAAVAELPDPASSTVIYSANSAVYIPRRIIKQGAADLVITSPPYGDSATTVSYGQFSALPNQWIFEMVQPRSLDKQLMGGIKAKRLRPFRSEVLNSQIQEIYNVDPDRALDVVRFYRDYCKSIRNIASVIRKGGFACYVVSNRTVRGINLKTNLITLDFFKNEGFQHIATFERRISHKRLPKRNSSNGKHGCVSDLMNKEYVIVMQR